MLSRVLCLLTFCVFKGFLNHFTLCVFKGFVLLTFCVFKGFLSFDVLCFQGFSDI